jgi:hypothetical protein
MLTASQDQSGEQARPEVYWCSRLSAERNTRFDLGYIVDLHYGICHHEGFEVSFESDWAVTFPSSRLSLCSFLLFLPLTLTLPPPFPVL